MRWGGSGYETTRCAQDPENRWGKLSMLIGCDDGEPVATVLVARLPNCTTHRWFRRGFLLCSIPAGNWHLAQLEDQWGGRKGQRERKRMNEPCGIRRGIKMVPLSEIEASRVIGYSFLSASRRFFSQRPMMKWRHKEVTFVVVVVVFCLSPKAGWSWNLNQAWLSAVFYVVLTWCCDTAPHA